MLSFSSRDGVATTTRKTPDRSEGSKRRACQDILPARAHCATASVASGATTLTAAPAATKPPILGSPTRPAPTTRHGRPVSFKNTGNKLILDPYAKIKNPKARTKSAFGVETAFGLLEACPATGPRILARLHRTRAISAPD